mgnify:CR=1 FL=1
MTSSRFCLHVRRELGVDFSVEMDGEVRYSHQRTVDMYQSMLQFAILLRQQSQIASS